MRKAKLNDEQYSELLVLILNYISVIPLETIKPFVKEADKLIGTIDPNDVVFLATALSLNAPIWSDDKHFEQQDRVKVMKTKDMVS